MGGHAYWYWVPYRDDMQAALDDLRKREFEAGRYNPVIPFLEFDEPAFSAQNPGKQHKTIKAAMKASEADGTRSILDIAELGEVSDHGVAGPVSEEDRVELFGSAKPTRKAIEENTEPLSDLVERGKAICIVAYDDAGAPTELFFLGYSYD